MYEGNLLRYANAKIKTELEQVEDVEVSDLDEPVFDTLFDIIRLGLVVGCDLTTLNGFHLTANTEEAEVCRGLLFK
ncbi:hypothetical protein MOA67_gp249 [Klebsiella phage KpLz-2_45]|uniref:hypothetical protein n=1 Tax=Klebsiella phage KpLz-2_45 TaxID=2698923 RepID=UPI001F1421CF|nr:hypothetical protein MOA67_gp249 [Klebsiella phage KpLz-2_45]UKS72174.1 hypothetical protein KpLz245_3080 [Klebsiella phage KpLz-2_45]